MKRTVSLFLLFVFLSCFLSSCGIFKKTPKYIGERSADWDDTKKGWRVFWAFYDKEDSVESLKSDATIKVVIKDDDGHVLYNKQHEVTEENYAKWSNILGNERILGSIFISINDVEKGTTESGTLSIAASVEDGSFNPEDVYVYNLPLMDMDIDLPALPMTVTQYDYYDKPELTAEILKAEIKYDYSCKITVTFKMTSHSDGDNTQDYVEFCYRIIDDDGIVVDSGNILSDKIRVGDTTREDIYAYDLKLGEHYILEFSDYHW